MKLLFEFELTEPEFNLLMHIYTVGFAEYRDTEFETVDDFKLNDEKFFSGIRTLNWFLERNTNGTFHLIENLYKFNLIRHVEMAWHTTYELSEFGKLVLTFNKL